MIVEKINDPLVIATIVIAIGTLALAAFSLWQTRIARDSARRQVRAYIGIQGGGIQLVNNGTMARVSIVFTNKGHSPAYDFSTWLKARIDLPSNLPFEDELAVSDRDSISVCLPGAEANCDTALSISPQELNDLRAGAKLLFVWGGVDYTDAFKGKRHFKLRATAAVDPSGTWTIRPHKFGYSAN